MRPFHHNSNMGRGGGEGSGPMLTEHLRDLDLELELLKRKREMIEKQQSLLNQQQAFNLQSFNFDQPQSFRDQHYDDGQYNSNDFSSSNRDYSSSGRDFSHLYNEPQQSRDRFPRQSAKKRLGDYVWSDPPIKRPFGGPSNKFGSGPANKPGSGPPNKFGSGPPNKFGSGPPNKFGPGPGNKFGSGPAKKFGPGPSPKQSKYVSPAERHAFVKNQPGKPKPSERFKAPPKPVKPKPNDFKPTKVVKPKTAFANKASTYVPKKFVAELVPKGDQGVKPILQPDQPPSQQTAGRLELALGNILKVIKDKYGKEPQYQLFFSEPMTNKAMKQEIRERIRKVMVGKAVGHVVEIMKMYREVYPHNTDKEIVEIGMKKKLSKPVGDFKFRISTDANISPYSYFKRNFSQLLSHSVNKLFAKIEAMSIEETLKREKEEKDATTSNDATAPAEAVKTETTEAYDPEKPTEEKVSEETKEENISENSKGEDVTEKSKEEKDITEESKGEEEAKDESGLTEESKGDAIEQTHGENVTDNPEESKDLGSSTQNIRYPLSVVRSQYEKMMDEMMPKKLAFWLPKLKSQIMKALVADYDFKTVTKLIVEKTEAQLNKQQNPETSTPDGKSAESRRPKLKYYVKIQGRPMLPKKPLMKPFLDQFNPKVVKKIKSLRNLLFVGFENKADFDRIVAANGTIVGTDKIIVKISQWVTSDALNAPAETTSTPNTSATEGDVTMKDADLNDTSELNTSLDNQIDELLTSIRNEEEAENENQDGGEEKTNVDDTDEAENGENVVPGDDGTEDVAAPGDDGNEEAGAPGDDGNEDAGVTGDDGNEDAGVTGDDGNEDAGVTGDDGTEDVGAEEDNEAANTGNGTEEVLESTENNEQEKAEAKDKVEELKSDAKETGRVTPTRASTRLASSAPTTPSTIRTRRASRLAQN